VVGFQIVVILDPMGMTFDAVVVFMLNNVAKAEKNFELLFLFFLTKT
jgi:antitoxin component of RelBE/YafQ-DinJ toxin-antitoxin module